MVLAGGQALFGESVRYGIATTIAAALTMLAVVVTRQSIVLRRDRHLRQEIGELSTQIDGLISQVGRDPLTGLLNHTAIHERIDHELAFGRVNGEPVAVALIDVDNFKSINDSLGHQAGDRVLRAVASVLTAACRGTDVAARYAGDEFMLLLPGLDESNAGVVCVRIAREVRRINDDLNFGQIARVSLSIGVAVTHKCRRSVSQTVAIADAAMYDAKENGKDRVVVVNADTLAITDAQVNPRSLDHTFTGRHAPSWDELDWNVG
jgi:diguanylate cyclase (GGDEF)-like protein